MLWELDYLGPASPSGVEARASTMCFLEDLSVGDFRMAIGCGFDGESLAFRLAGPTTFHRASSESFWFWLLRIGVVDSVS
jgi:hypothetical protein